MTEAPALFVLLVCDFHIFKRKTGCKKRNVNRLIF